MSARPSIEASFTLWILGRIPAIGGDRAIRGSAIAPAAVLCTAAAPRPSYPLRGPHGYAAFRCAMKFYAGEPEPHFLCCLDTSRKIPQNQNPLGHFSGVSRSETPKLNARSALSRARDRSGTKTLTHFCFRSLGLCPKLHFREEAFLLERIARFPARSAGNAPKLCSKYEDPKKNGGLSLCRLNGSSPVWTWTTAGW
jgi:hypothetical protein